jgi:transposase-like protein
LYDWKATPGIRTAPQADLQAENAALRRENELLRQQRDILKKTLGIISEPPQSASNGST